MPVNVAWQQATSYPAAVDRLALVAGMTHLNPTEQRQGVVIARGNPLAVSSGGAMAVIIQPGFVTFSDGYIMSVTTAVTLTVAAGGAGARTDLIVARVRDTDFGDATTGGAIEIVQGTTTTAPSTPARSVALATVYVAAGASSLSGTNLTDKRVFTAAAGGVVPQPGALATSPSTLFPDGTPVWDALAGTAGQLGIVSGTGWKRFESITDGPIVQRYDAAITGVNLAAGSGPGSRAVGGSLVIPARAWDSILIIDLGAYIWSAAATTDISEVILSVGSVDTRNGRIVGIGNIGFGHHISVAAGVANTLYISLNKISGTGSVTMTNNNALTWMTATSIPVGRA